MRSNVKWLRLAIYPALALLLSGCGGIHASKSISPLDFFLPGLLQSDPPPAEPDSSPAEEPPTQVAQF